MGDVDAPSRNPLPVIVDMQGHSFLIDTGAEVSVVQPTSYEQAYKTTERTLTAANGTSIATYGNRPITIHLGSGKVYRWIFVVADVPKNIIGMDFIQHFAMSLDFERNCLLDCNKNLLTKFCSEKIGYIEAPKLFAINNTYLRVLAKYPNLTRPPNTHGERKIKVSHKIMITGYNCSARARPLSPEKLQCAQAEINDLLDAGIIRRSDSPYSSPLHMVPKLTSNGGTYRLCGDYRQLNTMTIEDKYPIPNVQSLFHRLDGANIFSKIDLVKAYHQIPMDPESIPLTAIITPFGLFEYLYMPFGLCNASATFQRFIDNVLQGMTNALAYIDDIIVFSSNEEEHKLHLDELFQRLNNHGIVINPTKSDFGLTQMKFLGHLVTPEGISPLPEKIEAVTNYPVPKTKKQLRAYLGFINYYHRFVKNLAPCLSPLYDLIKGPSGNKNIRWTSDAKNAFQQSKNLLAETTMLVFPKANLPTQIVVDASDMSLGSVLQQKHGEVWKPIAFYSRKLDKTQKKYSAFDRELLAAYKSVKHFLYLVDGMKFTLVTDHKPLVSAFYSKSDQVIGRRARQLSFISEFTNNVQHLKGTQNVVADTLSRIEINNLSVSQNPLDFAEIALAQREDDFIQQVLTKSVKTSLVFEELPLEDCNLVLICDTSTSKVRPVIPANFQKLVFEKIHNLSHPGIKATRELIQRRFVWQNMKKDIAKWVRNCQSCQKGKVLRHNKAPLQRFDLPSERFSHLHVDIVGPLPPSNEYRYILTVIDRFSRWFTATPMKEITAEATIESLLSGWIQYYGVPECVTTDRGSQFTSQTWKEMMQFLGIKHITTTSYHPQSNGIVENVHRRLKDALRMQEFPAKWSQNLPLVMLTIRNSVKDELQCSPADLVYGQSLRLPQEFRAPMLEPCTPSQFVSGLKEHFKNLKAPPTRIQANSSYIDQHLNKCKQVLVRNDHVQNPLELRYSGPYHVLDKQAKYFLISINGKPKTVSIDRLKAFHEDEKEKTTRSGRTIRPPSRFSS